MGRILYKYLDINGAISMIGNMNLQFTNASQLNDPFDCHPRLIDYSNVTDNNQNGCIPPEWRTLIEENNALNRRNETWLCSLSKVNNSILMWSHYCRSHSGVCIGLDIDKILESVPPMFGQIFLEPLVLDVQYQNIIERPDAHYGSLDKYNYQWTTKAKEWEYEQEVRLVMPKPSPSFFAYTQEQAKHRKKVWDRREIHCYMPILGECFDSIYFGVNTDQIEKEKFIRYAKEKLNPQIKLYQMKVDDNALRLKPETT